MKYFGGCIVYSFHDTVPFNWVGRRSTWGRLRTSINKIRYWKSSKDRRCYSNVTEICEWHRFTRKFDTYIEPLIYEENFFSKS